MDDSGKDSSEKIVVETDPDGRYQRYTKQLGQGAYKTVYKAFDSDTGLEVAWNQVQIGKLEGEAKKQFIDEVTMLSRLNHKHIIQFHDSWEDHEKHQVIFITELMTSGTLKSFVKARKVNLRMVRKWSKQILSALKYLHEEVKFEDPPGSGNWVVRPIIHRDLKCDNIFINGNLGEVKIGDLGLSTMMSQTHAATVTGTPEFMAPELYEEQYNEKVDIYAFGMCILEIFSDEYPYSECTNPAQIFKKVSQGIPPRALLKMENVAVKHFIELCLAKEEDRPTASQLLEHDFLRDLEDPVAITSKDGQTQQFSEGVSPLLSPTERQMSQDVEAFPQEVGNREGGSSQLSSAPAPNVELISTKMTKLEPDSMESSGDEDNQGTGKITINANIDGKNKLIEFTMDPDNDSCEEVAQELVQELLAKDNVVCVDEIDKCELPPTLVNKFTEEIEKAVQQFKIEIGEVSPEEGSVLASAAASWRQSSSFSSSNTNFVVETPKSQPETASAAVTQQAPKLHQSGSLDGIQMNGTAQPHTAQANTSPGSSINAPHMATGVGQASDLTDDHPAPLNQHNVESETLKDMNDTALNADLISEANGESSLERVVKPNLQAEIKTEATTAQSNEAHAQASQKDTFSFAEIGSHLLDASSDVAKEKADSHPAKTSTQGDSATNLPDVDEARADVAKEVEVAFKERMEELEKLRLQSLQGDLTALTVLKTSLLSLVAKSKEGGHRDA